MRATSRSASADERRHWCTAQCSLSTGTSSAPGVARSGCTTGPAAIRLSLLASASRLPRRSVAIVTGSPAKPTTALTTTSASSTRSARSSTTVANGSAAATSARRAGSPTATKRGRNSLAWAMSDVDGRADAEGDDLVARRLGADDVERLGADRAGRAGDGDADRRSTAPRARAPASRSTRPGSTNKKASKRSSTPPWPLTSVPKSFTSRLRLNMLSVRSPSGANTAMTTPRISRSPVVHVSLRPVRPTTNSTRSVSSVPPIRPSTVLPGLIHARSGVLPIDEPTSRAPMSLATTPSTIRNSVSVPMLLPARPPFDQRTISAANEPSRPIHTTPIVVTAMFGSGPDSTPAAPMNPTAPAMKAKAMTSGSALDRRPSRRRAARRRTRRGPGATAGR